MAPFSYGPFSEEAREAVVTAADVAIGQSSASVLPEHLKAATEGAVRSERPVEETGRIPFDPSTMSVLEQAHDAAVSADETVELHHLRDALGEQG